MLAKEQAIPSHLVLTSVLSGSLTILFSIVFTGLTIVGLIFRFDCDAFPLESLQLSDLFMTILYRTYILESSCPLALTIPGVTSDYSVLVLNSLTLTFSVLTAVAAVVLISVVTSNSVTKWLKLIVFHYVAVSVCMLIVDLTYASHFGMDYTYLTDVANNGTLTIEGQIASSLRIGSFFFMSLCLKGFIGHFVNIVLLILLVVYTIQYRQLDGTAHSIHKVGAINAFDAQPKPASCTHQCLICQQINTQLSVATRSAGGGSQLNYGYMHEEEPPRSPRNVTSKPDYTNSSGFDRSNSWQATQLRPFSYLDDVKRAPAPPMRPSSPSSDTTVWRRDPWREPVPPVPAPDYSPHSQRRLKSALKSYM